MKNTPSTSSHDSFFLPETPKRVIHVDEDENPKEGNNTVTRKSRIQRVAKSFGEDYIIYLVDDTPTTIAEAYYHLMLICRKKLFKVKWILLCLMGLGNWLIVLMDVNLWGASGYSKRC